MLTNKDDAQQQLQDLIKKVKATGADAADAILAEGLSMGVSWRGGALESLEHSEGADLGLRVLFGKRQAVVATTDRSEAALDELVDRVVSMAKAAPEDPHCGIAEPDQIAKDYPSLELADTYDCSVELLIGRAKAVEEAALSIDGVTQCEGADAGAGMSQVTLASSNGFIGSTKRTSYSISTSALAGEGTEMERDYDWDSKIFQEDLGSATDIGHNAGKKAVARLGARKMPSCTCPIIFDPRESRGLLGHFVGAINGVGIARGTSFLKDYMDKAVFNENITIIDDPHLPRGCRTKAYDGEGIATQKRTIVDGGVLQTWLLDLRTSRQLGLQTTGHAARGTSSMPSPSATNLYMEAGQLTPEELMADIKSGFYVTETMGMGVNGVTGDFSQAAAGFWIENGQITHPVSEITIAGNLKEMYQQTTPANNLTHRYGIDAPTLRVEKMIIAGS